MKRKMTELIKKSTCCVLSAVILFTLIFSVTVYAGEVLYEPEKVDAIGGYRSDKDTNYKTARLGGTANNIEDGYFKTDSCDAKVTFVRIDTDLIPIGATKAELKFTGGNPTRNDRNGIIRLYTALADMTTTVVTEGQAAAGNEWDKVTWNMRPHLGTINVAGTVTAGQDFKVDITDLIKDKSGKVTVAVLGDKAETTNAEATYSKVRLVCTVDNMQSYECTDLKRSTSTVDDVKGEVANTEGTLRYLIQSDNLQNLSKVTMYQGWRENTETLSVYACAEKPSDLDAEFTNPVGSVELTHQSETTFGYFYSDIPITGEILADTQYIVVEQKANRNVYAKTITLIFKVNEETPNIAIDYVNEKLTGFADGSYTIDGNAVTPVNGELPVAEYIGKKIAIVKTGNGTTTIDSTPQILEISARPTTLTADTFTVVQPDEIGEKGSIIGITTAMEYSTDNGASWTTGTGEVISEIAGGTTYFVRVKATDIAFRSESCSITINTFGATQEETPNIAIDYVNEKLTGFADGSYTIDGNAVTPENGELPVADYIGQTIAIVKTGNDTTTIDSAPQSLKISARPTAPTTDAFIIAQPSTIDGKGSITGITTAMEYSADNGVSWTTGTGEAISEIAGGTTYLVRVKATDNAFKSESYSITINTFNAAQETKPAIAIDYANEKLTSFAANSVYKINNTEITPETTEIDIADYIGQEITIVKSGNGTTTIDSAPQSLEIPARPSAPTGLEAVSASDTNVSDGKITGVEIGMEYRLSSDNEWTDVSGNEITGLAQGVYQVRVKAGTAAFASESISVTVNTVGKYVITFLNYDGAELGQVSITAGDTPSYNGTPERPQDDKYTYTFNGWTPEITAATENASYTAQFTPSARTYTVMLDTNGGTIESGNVESYTYGTAAVLPEAVTKDNHTFEGWYDNPDCTGEAVTEISETDTGNKTYYAKWKEIKTTEYLNVLDAFKDKLKIEKSYREDGSVALTILPVENNALPELRLYTAIYSERGVLQRVSVTPCNAADGKIELTLTKPAVNDNESYKIMLWTDEYAPVIAAISMTTGLFK